MQSSSTQVPILRVKAGRRQEELDFLAAEEPLEIRLLFGPTPARQQQPVSVTMRTPGQDFDLAVGFLFTEGILRGAADVRSVTRCGASGNVVRVSVKSDVPVDLPALERHFYTTSSCGLCGKASIDAVRTVCRLGPRTSGPFRISADLLVALPEKLRQAQDVFEHTGGLHGCALFDAAGTCVLSREDVGRHNAVDKLIGAALQRGLVPLDGHLLLLSGRASFELVQKAWMAGIPVVAAVGAPSSLAVSLAADAGITLVGFLRNGGFNIYTGGERIVFSEHEDSH